jgi:hypothetical protein
MFRRQLFLSSGGQSIDLHALLVLRNLPFGRDPSLPLQAMQNRTERACINLENLARVGPNRLADAVSVLRSPLQRLQNQQVECPLKQLNPILIALLLRQVDILHAVS